jgi:hypothetical protein
LAVWQANNTVSHPAMLGAGKFVGHPAKLFDALDKVGFDLFF